ncbi:oligosaccharide biosynthesis protein Alg14-like protein [Cokeromyces recurvatus]|uniref:oligosaccharide biosynthesis protein Alg14-like protein n=1 Tax=Cokeromyces recurvatus TaxID=90255 RepID=UPI002220893B|nr:oligosaccharide biosynthesis protein Alg14-like protein [Cokeromyces recurvatus]KAI7901371.1 oligosaccharide biosynthesis protein Alg14-like protein [Cokeromyces recurvatus]
MLNVIIFSLTFIILFLLRLWLILPKQSKYNIQKRRTKACKTCIFLGSGGHTAEMLQLVKSLHPITYSPRSYIITNTDILSKEKAIEHENSLKKGKFDIYTIPRAREVGQSWLTVPKTVIVALLASIRVMLLSWPDLIICNGPGSCIPICMLAYLPRMLGIKKIEIIYVESFARVHTLSLTGKLLYLFVDRFLVQWPELSHRFNKAEYKGILV